MTDTVKKIHSRLLVFALAVIALTGFEASAKGSRVAEFIESVQPLDSAARAEAVRNFASTVAKADSETYDRLTESADSLMYDPESSCYDDVLYTQFVGELHKLRPDDFRLGELLSQLEKNAPGSRAADISYMKPSGKEGWLSDFAGRSVVLIFYDPDCDKCHHLMDVLAASPAVNAALAGGTLAVVAIYPDDDTVAWRSHASTLPLQWSVGIDKDQMINNEDAYILRNIPSVYLIGPDGRVILRDTSEEKLLRALSL